MPLHAILKKSLKVFKGKKSAFASACLADSTQIFIQDYRIDMSIGIRQWERTRKQSVSVSLYANVINENISGNDDIDLTVSYGDLVREIQTIAEAGHIDLLETAAEKIADMCLAYKLITRVQVSVSKPDIYNDIAHVGAMITRYKHDIRSL